MEQLKELNLTENDFQLLVDGLDALPEKGAAGNIMVDLLGMSMLEGEARAEFEKKRDEDNKKRDREKQILIENVRILQGKLLMMKRLLIEGGIIKEANQLIQQ